jgi:hypothetical protein
MFLEAVSVRNILPFEGWDEMLAVGAIGTTVVDRLMDPKTGLSPKVQIANDLETVLILELGILFVSATLTATTAGQRVGNLKAVTMTVPLVAGYGHIRRKIEIDCDGSHDFTLQVPQPVK